MGSSLTISNFFNSKLESYSRNKVIFYNRMRVEEDFFEIMELSEVPRYV